MMKLWHLILGRRISSLSIIVWLKGTYIFLKHLMTTMKFLPNITTHCCREMRHSVKVQKLRSLKFSYGIASVVLKMLTSLQDVRVLFHQALFFASYIRNIRGKSYKPCAFIFCNCKNFCNTLFSLAYAIPIWFRIYADYINAIKTV